MAQTAIVIGAGVIGVCSAYSLARRGWRVTIIDRELGPAMVTSHANGAQLSYCYTDALGNPRLLASLPKLLLGKGGVSFGFSMRPDYLRWLAQFARNCSAARFRQNTLAVLDLAAQSRRAMDSLCEQHNLDFAHRVAGKIHMLYSENDRRQAQQVCVLKRKAGCRQDIIPRSEFAALDPALAGLDSEANWAISTPSEMVGDPLLFCRSLLDVLDKEYGVEARFGVKVEAIEDAGNGGSVMLSSGEQLNADRVVVASGMGSTALLSRLGDTAAIQPMKGYSFEMPVISGSPRVSVTDGKRRLVMTNLGTKMRVAGIAELGNSSHEIDAARIAWLQRAARECLPEGGDYTKAGAFWTGLRPATPNSQPIIRRAGKAFAINAGHGALGWTLAMGSGERLADILED